MMKYQGKLRLMDNNGGLIKEIPVSSDDGLKWQTHEVLPSGDWWPQITRALKELYPTLTGDPMEDLELNIMLPNV